MAEMVSVLNLLELKAKIWRINYRTEYEDYEDDYESTMYPPSIIYDPYDITNKNDFSIEGRFRINE